MTQQQFERIEGLLLEITNVLTPIKNEAEDSDVRQQILLNEIDGFVKLSTRKRRCLGLAQSVAERASLLALPLLKKRCRGFTAFPDDETFYKTLDPFIKNGSISKVDKATAFKHFGHTQGILLVIHNNTINK